MSHNLKNVAKRYGVGVVFSAPKKLKRVCAVLERKAEQRKESETTCGVKHETMYVPCAEEVVYKIPMSCGQIYIGQTGRCINTRLKEHANNLEANKSNHLVDHVRDCQFCFPSLPYCDILYKHPSRLTREIMEAYHMKKKTRLCVSKPSISLYDSEVAYLDAT